MTTKLTLSADRELVRKAHRLAKQDATSVSAMFSRFIRALPEEGDPRPLGPLMQQAAGLAKLPKGKTYRDVLTDTLLEKYDLR